MLKNYEILEEIEKNEYKTKMREMEIELGVLQREAREKGIPVVIVIDGFEASGKGMAINNMLMAFDARGCSVYHLNKMTEDEKYRPFFWKFWQKIPPKGRIAIFDESWYQKIITDTSNKNINKKDCKRIYESTNSFEKQLTDDGTLIIKFFMHITQEEQKKRLKKILENKSEKWKITKQDIKNNKNYDKIYESVEEVLKNTNTENASWNIIDASDKKTAVYKMFDIIIKKMDEKIRKNKLKEKGYLFKDENIPEILKYINLDKKEDEKNYETKLKKLQKRLRELEHEIYIKKIPVVISYEGWDAAGKGGNIKRLVNQMDPRGYEVIPISAPNDIERQHHYLWRFWSKVPKAGHITIFDRTWYGRVLVERVEKFCDENDWCRAYSEINDMERQWTDYGILLIKFWVHIDKETQYKRFKEREEVEYKKWKITEEDWRNREKWDEYEKAVNEMIHRTNTKHAPWYILESNCKMYARIKAMEIIIEKIEEKLIKIK